MVIRNPDPAVGVTAAIFSQGKNIDAFLTYEGLICADKVAIFKGKFSIKSVGSSLTIKFFSGSRGNLFDATIGTKITRINWPSADVSAIGRIEPILLGRITDHKTLIVSNGAVTTLSKDTTFSTSTLSLTETERDGSIFPAFGQVVIGSEELGYSFIVDKKLYGVTPREREYSQGTKIFQKVTNQIFLVSGIPVSAVNNIRVIPFNSEVVESVLLNPDTFTVTLDSGGKTIVTVTDIIGVNKQIEAVIGDGLISVDRIAGDLICDVEGPVDDGSGTYTGTPGLLIEQVTHCLNWIIDNLSNGATLSDIDTDSLTDLEDNFFTEFTYSIVIDVQTTLNKLLTRLGTQAFFKPIWEAGLFKTVRFKESEETAVKALDTDNDHVQEVINPENINNTIAIDFRKFGYQNTNQNKVYDAVVVNSNLNRLKDPKKEASYKTSFEQADGSPPFSKTKTFLMPDIVNDSHTFNLSERYHKILKIDGRKFFFTTYIKNIELERGDVVTLTIPQLSGITTIKCAILNIASSLPSARDKRTFIMDMLLQKLEPALIETAFYFLDGTEFLDGVRTMNGPVIP